MPDLAHIESMKLLANWCNAASIASIAGGTAAPIVSYVYEIGPQMADPSNIWILAPVCLLAGCCLHLLGQFFVGGLNDAE